MPCACCFGRLTDLPVAGDAPVRGCRRCEGGWDGVPGAVSQTGRCPRHGPLILHRQGDLSRPLPNVTGEYQTPVPNVSLPIAAGKAELHQEMANATPLLVGEGSLVLEWTPHVGVVASFTSTAEGNQHVGEGPASLRLVDAGLEASFSQYPSGSRWSDGVYTVDVRGHVTTDFLRSSRPLSSVTTHLVNCPTFLWTELQDSSWFGGLRMLGGGWEVVLRQVSDHESQQALRRTSGYAITHVCRATRADGSPFNAAEAENLLQAFLLFFSFARAAWATPVLAVGRDPEGSVSLRQLSTWNASPGNWYPSWMDDQHPEALMELFPGFWALWIDPRSKEMLRRAVYWYVTANTSASADVGLILAQAALDHLSWRVVFDEGRAEMTDYQQHHVSARIQALLNQCQVPTSIPAATSRLMQLALQDHGREPALRSGPIALTSARNAILHPDWNTDRAAAEAAVLDARNLALWYLELCLLFWMGYTGDHQWRLRVRATTGHVEPVPWAAPERWTHF